MNTLRNQIFLGFMFVMAIVLASVGYFTYDQVSVLLRNNAERHIEQTAVQASGKLDVLVRQIETFTAQVATSETVQQLLAQEASGREITFEQRQLIQREARKQEAYTTGVRSLELYAPDLRMLLPLTDVSLNKRVPMEWIHLADDGKGQLVWFGTSPSYPDSVIALRRIRLVDQSFAEAGYLMVQVDKHYFELNDTPADSMTGKAEREPMGLFDSMGNIIVSDFASVVDVKSLLADSRETVSMNGEDYIAVQHQSEATGWRIMILTPEKYATEGISILRTAVIVSGIVGGVLFLILTFILSTMITRPILNLIKAMRFARFGNLKTIPVVSSTLELDELHNTYNQMVVSLNELIEVVYQKEIVQSRTELKALQAQINPHFLFNTLEAFFWALEDKGEEELAQLVVAMSGLFRYVISRADEDEWVTIADELDHAERYLKIMDMRMMDRLEYRIEAEEESRRVPIPKLLIQPIIENAINHGVEQKLGKGMVTVRVRPAERAGYTRIEVSDNGPGIEEDKLQSLKEAIEQGRSHPSAKGTGVGIVNVSKRLTLYYEADSAGLDIRSEVRHGTAVAFEIPNEHGGRTV